MINPWTFLFSMMFVLKFLSDIPTAQAHGRKVTPTHTLPRLLHRPPSSTSVVVYLDAAEEDVTSTLSSPRPHVQLQPLVVANLQGRQPV